MNGLLPAGSSVLVTGAAGFIGTALCRRLSDVGVEVHGTWRARPPTAAAGTVHWSQIELSDDESVEALVARVRPDTVFHLAGLVTGSRDLGTVVPSLQTLASTVHVLTAAARHGCRQVLMAGSMEEPESGCPPSSPYAAAKASGRVYGGLFSALYELSVIHLRLFMTYGPGQTDTTKLVPSVALSMLRGEVPSMSTGQRRVDWIYVDDVVDGMLAAAASPLPSGTSIDLGTGALTSVAEVAQLIADRIGGDAELGLGALPDRPLELEPQADVDTTRALVGWSAQTSLVDGIDRTIEWCRTLVHAEDGADGG